MRIAVLYAKKWEALRRITDRVIPSLEECIAND